MVQGALDLGLRRQAWQPSAYQQAIFDAVEDPDGGNLAVRARAGSGKTTTICEAVRRIPRAARVLVCAFNKDIREELAKRLPLGIDVLTTHGLGLRGIVAARGKGAALNKDRTRNVLKERFPSLDQGPWRTATGKLVERAQATLAQTPDELSAAVDEAGICLEDLVPRARRSRQGLSDEQASELRAQLVAVAGQVLIELAEGPDRFDFNGMVWLPVVHGWAPVCDRGGGWDWVVVDEAQDLSRVQLELIASALAPGGRVLVVGDDKQAIYRFRGADSQAFDRLIERFACTVLPLSITYRCPTSVVALAKGLVPDYEAGEGAPAGEVLDAEKLDVARLQAGDFVLSRKNAPLVRHAIRALAAGVPAAIAGRDLAKDLGIILSAVARRCGGQREAVITTLVEHYGKRLGEAAQRDLDPAPIRDELDCLLALLDARPTVQESIELLDRLCSEKPGNVVLFSSVHRAKGLERDRVFVLTGTFRVDFRNGQPSGRQRGNAEEEVCLAYVAMTRAKKTLVLVHGEG